LQVYKAKYDPATKDFAHISASSDFNFPLHAGPLSMDSIQMFITNTPKKGPSKHRRLEEIIPQISWHNKATGDIDLITDTPTSFLTDPFWDSNNQKLYFSADYPEGKGQLDLYFMELKRDGSWVGPFGLGDAVNTYGIERSPFVHRDTLYFASDGLGGLGGLDIYFVPLLSSKDLIPENMGVPYNSNKDDFFFVIDENLGGLQVLSSDRDGGMGMDDLYYINKLPDESIRRIIIEVEDAETHAPLSNIGVELQKKNLTTYQNFLTEENGITGFFVTRADTLINLKVFGQDYLNYEVFDLSILGVDTIFIDLQRLHLNTPLMLRDIYYDFDKYTIRSQESESIIKLASILNENKSLNVLLRSHADSRGTFSYNQKLSEKRAKSVVDFLVRMGINKDRISTESYGETYPLTDCGESCSEVDHQLNRRTEIIFYQGSFQATPYEYPLLDMKNGNRMEVKVIEEESFLSENSDQDHKEADSIKAKEADFDNPKDDSSVIGQKELYFLIAASFPTYEDAEKHVDTLKKELNQEIIILPIDLKSKRYRVALGVFNSYENAASKMGYYQKKLKQNDLWILATGLFP
tara:strand:- start:75 stop:1811 length:1737 start_codon:yes stop_codon:yes gene_type:complete